MAAKDWIPAFAGMTVQGGANDGAGAGMTMQGGRDDARNVALVRSANHGGYFSARWQRHLARLCRSESKMSPAASQPR